MNDIISKLNIFDELFAHALIAGNMSVKDDIIIDSDGNEMSWEDCDFIPFKKCIQCEDYCIDGILLFGDGTLEFHDANTEEAFNWADFPLEFIEEINEFLKFIITPM